MSAYRPSEVIKTLGISSSTLKNWVKWYAPFLSPGASLAGQPRYFTPDDLRVLAFVAEHSRQGLPRFEITARLDAGELASFEYTPPEDAPPQPATDSAEQATPGQLALVLVTRMQNDLDAARERERELIDRLITAEQRASRAEGELSELRASQQRPGFWRRLFGG